MFTSLLCLLLVCLPCSHSCTSVQAEHAYRNLDLPLLNRFEKQLLCASDLLRPALRAALVPLKEWCALIAEECANALNHQDLQINSSSNKTSGDGCMNSSFDMALVFPGFDVDTSLATLLLSLDACATATSGLSPLDESSSPKGGNAKEQAQDGDGGDGTTAIHHSNDEEEKLVRASQELLAQCASPLAHAFSLSLESVWQRLQTKHLDQPIMAEIVTAKTLSNDHHYSAFEVHGDLKALLAAYLGADKSNTLETTTTLSQIDSINCDATQPPQSSDSVLQQGSVSSCAQLLSVATYSSLPELTPSLLAAAAPPGCRHIRATRLAAVASEWQLREALVNFYSDCSGNVDPAHRDEKRPTNFQDAKAGTDEDVAVLVLQCDPATAPPALLVHVRHCVERARADWCHTQALRAQLAACRKTATLEPGVTGGGTTASAASLQQQQQRHVVVVVHAPPGGRQRKWSLDMHFSLDAPWRYAFLDDVSPDKGHQHQSDENNSSNSDLTLDVTSNKLQQQQRHVLPLPSTYQLLRTSLVDLCAIGLQTPTGSAQWLGALLLPALGRCSSPQPSRRLMPHVAFQRRLTVLHTRLQLNAGGDARSSEGTSGAVTKSDGAADSPHTSSSVPHSNAALALIHKCFLQVLVSQQQQSQQSVSSKAAQGSSLGNFSCGGAHVRLACGLNAFERSSSHQHQQQQHQQQQEHHANAIVAGSTRQSLALAAEAILVHALSHVLAAIDTDFSASADTATVISALAPAAAAATAGIAMGNSSSKIGGSCDHLLPPWLAWLSEATNHRSDVFVSFEALREATWAANIVATVDPLAVARRAGRHDNFGQTLVVDNSGKSSGGALVACFPMSSRVFTALDGDAAKDLLSLQQPSDQQKRLDTSQSTLQSPPPHGPRKNSVNNVPLRTEVRSRAARLEGLTNSLFGEEALAAWSRWAVVDHGMSFLQDWVEVYYL